jgi:hypothetical protein
VYKFLVSLWWQLADLETGRHNNNDHQKVLFIFSDVHVLNVYKFLVMGAPDLETGRHNNNDHQWVLFIFSGVHVLNSRLINTIKYFDIVGVLFVLCEYNLIPL